jgi:hypothetical protein
MAERKRKKIGDIGCWEDLHRQIIDIKRDSSIAYNRVKGRGKGD